ncbi:MAG: hypothetical protein J7574_14080 [Flavobacterium sp.]|uniref:hypothetical protein n=1 Tax=Flavobacterium sp. TaxID=239 RepID=UPI001B08E2FC|nr:hypothetical protein [Flavobacterium sp.]MBO9585287.1 hypothetical protein [Flavobacterium sp.]
MSNIYPLEWLDSLIVQTLNPKKTNVAALSEKDLALISENAQKESQRIQVLIKNEIFALFRKRQIRLLVRRYHSNLIFLLDTLIENQNFKELKTNRLSLLMEQLIEVLDEMLCFIENRFANYLSMDERVPITYLIVSRKELKMKLSRLKALLAKNEKGREKIQIVIDALSESIGSKTQHKVTFRQIRYERDLLKALNNQDYTAQGETFFGTADQILIAMNFNSRKYISLLTEEILKNIEKEEESALRLELLLLYYKDFNHLPSNEKITFDPSMENIKPVLDNWFKNETAYWEKKKELGNSVRTRKSKSIEEKVECDFSADQLGLILRAADESRLIKARSMNLVFQSIIPHLSTAFKKELSYQSVRSKSYNAEEKDKETAIAGLEKMIRKIRSY